MKMSDCTSTYQASDVMGLHSHWIQMKEGEGCGDWKCESIKANLYRKWCL